MKKKIFITSIIAIISISFSCSDNLNSILAKRNKEIPPASINIDSDTGLISIVKGKTHKINAYILPANASDKKLYFASDNEPAASIDKDGLITAHKPGRANITVSTGNNIKKDLTVEVQPEPVAVIRIINTAEIPMFLTVGDILTLNLELEPFSATNKNYTIKSDNTEIAWPDRVQGIRAQKAGTANIIVESESNPEVKLIIPIKVKKRPEIIVDDKPLNYGSSNPGQTSFAVKTLHGKLDYTPEIQGNVNWLTFTVDNSADDKDIINFKFAENKTPWDKIAYVKFKNKKTGKYIGKPEGRKNQKDFTVKIIQAKNTNPPNVKIRWVHGVTPPTESEKTRIKYNNDTQLAVPYAFTWTETASTNFFNARKASYVQPVTAGPAIPDTNACWAKTSTNMLHWWFEQNKENIEKYKKTLQGDTSLYDVSYDRSLPDSKESTKSSIASVFSKNFKNAGGDMFSGIKWYLYEQPLNYRPKAPALFKEIFNKDSGLIEQKSVHSKTEFENMIKNALDSKKAIGFAVRRDRDQFWHGITLWGAAFDAEDNVIAIYIADSNDSRNIINAWGIHYQDSPRKNPYIMRFDLNAYDKNLYIDTVITLDKGEEQFKKFFDTHK